MPTKECPIEVFGDHIVVKRLDPKPDDEKFHAHIRGVVLVVGPGNLYDGKREPMDLAVGNVVIYRHYHDCDVIVNGEEFAVMSDASVICRIK